MKTATRFVLTLLLVVLAGCSGSDKEADLPYPSFFLEYGGVAPYETTREVELPVSGSTMKVFDKPVFTANEMLGVELVQVQRGMALRFKLDERARRKLERVSVDSMGYRLVLFRGEEPIGARQIDGMLGDGILYTFVEVPEEELPAMVEEMNKAIVQAHRTAWR